MLLPHLKFERVDISDIDPPRCIFGKDTLNQVDIDNLSRGKIEAISQYLPRIAPDTTKIKTTVSSSLFFRYSCINGYARHVSSTSITIKATRLH